jgi:hypothetical protein
MSTRHAQGNVDDDLTTHTHEFLEGGLDRGAPRTGFIGML